MLDIGSLIASVIQLACGLIVIWCLLSWFPNIRWYEPPFKWLDMAVKPIVEPFRRLIPPISGIDLSPMIAIILLQLAGNLVRQLLP
ncbi:MAG: YggT family protein [Candidatus Obscuribacterales bacterium]|nr:YggT family protein [Candidatus Obscuribacterales bacterium]